MTSSLDLPRQDSRLLLALLSTLFITEYLPLSFLRESWVFKEDQSVSGNITVSVVCHERIEKERESATVRSPNQRLGPDSQALCNGSVAMREDIGVQEERRGHQRRCERKAKDEYSNGNEANIPSSTYVGIQLKVLSTHLEHNQLPLLVDDGVVGFDPLSGNLEVFDD